MTDPPQWSPTCTTQSTWKMTEMLEGKAQGSTLDLGCCSCAGGPVLPFRLHGLVRMSLPPATPAGGQPR
jgi:hypothetical protein